MVVPQAFTQPVYVTVTKAIGYAGASGFSVWWRLLVTAHRSQDIINALRLAKEFNLKIVLDGASEAHMLINEIKASGE